MRNEAASHVSIMMGLPVRQGIAMSILIYVCRFQKFGAIEASQRFQLVQHGMHAISDLFAKVVFYMPDITAQVSPFDDASEHQLPEVLDNHLL